MPNGTNAVPSRVTAWLDARCSSDESLDALVGAVAWQAQDRTLRDGTSLVVTEESDVGAGDVRRLVDGRVAAAVRPAAPIPTQAGHDAGVLAAVMPTAMLFVRNPTGVSHAPGESAEMADCLAGVEALADVLGDLSR